MNWLSRLGRCVGIRRPKNKTGKNRPGRTLELECLEERVLLTPTQAGCILFSQ
jgi:hypothetical protein